MGSYDENKGNFFGVDLKSNKFRISSASAHPRNFPEMMFQKNRWAEGLISRSIEQEETRNIVFGGEGGSCPHLWLTSPKRGRESLSPLQKLQILCRKYDCQFPGICINKQQSTTICHNVPQFTSIPRNSPQSNTIHSNSKQFVAELPILYHSICCCCRHRCRRCQPPPSRKSTKTTLPIYRPCHRSHHRCRQRRQRQQGLRQWHR